MLRRDDLFAVALDDSGLLPDTVLVTWLDRPGRQPAWYLPPRVPLPDAGITGLMHDEAEKLVAASDRHRLAIHPPSFSSDAELLGALRHELQHALQHELCGHAAMCLAELTRQAVAAQYEGIGHAVLQLSTPLERQAHQAAFRLVDRCFGTEADQRRGGERKLLKLLGRLDVEGDTVDRVIAFAALHRRLLADRAVLGRTAPGHSDQLSPGAWARLVADAEFDALALRAAALRPSPEAVAEAERAAQPWVPVARCLMDGEERGLQVLVAASGR